MLKYKDIDKKNKKILDALQDNSRMSYSELAKNVGLVRETAYYRVLSLEKKGIIRKYVSFIDISKLGLSIYCVFLNLSTSSVDARKKIIERIRSDPNVTWAASVGSYYDLVFAIQATDARHFKTIYAELCEGFKGYIHEERFSQRVRLEANPIDNNPQKKTLTIYSGIENRTEIDDLDKGILKRIMEDSRISVLRLSDLLKRPGSTIKTRLKRLERLGIIQGYGILLDYERLGVQVYQLLITTTSLNKEESRMLQSYCRSIENIPFYAETIAPWSFEITVLVEDNAHLQSILNDLKEKLGTRLRAIEVIPTFDYYIKYQSLGKAV